MRSKISVMLTVLLACSANGADLKKQPFREWVDNTGDYRVRARLVDADRKSQSVQLQLNSGQALHLPMRRLSVADQKYVNSLAASPKSSAKPPQTENIAGIRWINNREDASRVALGGKSVQDDKPIMCFRALGDLSGFM